MPNRARISLLLLPAWVFLNLIPALISGMLWREAFFQTIIMFYSGYARLHPLVWRHWAAQAIDAFILLACCLTLFTLALWLRMPSIFRASMLIAAGPFVISIRLGLMPPISAFASPVALVPVSLSRAGGIIATSGHPARPHRCRPGTTEAEPWNHKITGNPCRRTSAAPPFWCGSARLSGPS